MTNQIYMAPEGVIDIDRRHFVGAFGEMDIPDDVWKRGCRLQLRGFRNRYEYMAQWCDYRLMKVWEASGGLHASAA